MTVTADRLDVEFVRELRDRVRQSLEDLRTPRPLDRPSSPTRDGAAGSVLVPEQAGFLRHHRPGIGHGTRAVIDAGTGPRTVVLSATDVCDDDVVALDSSLGRALLGASPGQRVRFHSPEGPCLARVLAVTPA